jgi:hypothetical protein
MALSLYLQLSGYRCFKGGYGILTDQDRLGEQIRLAADTTRLTQVALVAFETLVVTLGMTQDEGTTRAHPLQRWQKGHKHEG